MGIRPRVTNSMSIIECIDLPIIGAQRRSATVKWIRIIICLLVTFDGFRLEHN